MNNLLQSAFQAPQSKTNPLAGISTITNSVNGQGVGTSQGVILQAKGTLTVSAAINATSQAELVTSNGSILETSGGTVIAPGLLAEITSGTSGDINLNQLNDIAGFSAQPGNLAVANNVPGGFVTVDGGNQVGTVSDSVLGIGTVTGITTVDSSSGPFTNVVSLISGATLNIAAPIHAGSAEVELSAGQGITESSVQGIFAGSLVAANVNANGEGYYILLNQVNNIANSNNYGLIAATDNTPGGSITIYNMGYAIQVDSLSAAGIGMGTVTGITTASGNFQGGQSAPYSNNVNLWAALGVVINAPVNAPNAQVTLRSGVSWVFEPSPGTVTASAVVASAGTAAGSQVYMTQTNTIAAPSGGAGLFAAVNNAVGGAVSVYNMGGTLQVDSLSGAGVGLGTITGITTLNSAATPYANNINLWSSTAIVLNASLNAGFAGVELRASGGSITQNAGATISAGSLAAVIDAAAPANSNVSLGQTNMLVGSGATSGQIAIQNNSTGGNIVFVNASADPLHEATLSVAGVGLTTITGVTTTGGGTISITPTPT